MEMEEKTNKALSMRIAGQTYSEIAKECGISAGEAWGSVGQEVPTREDMHRARERARELMLDQLALVQDIIRDRVAGGDLAAIDTTLRIIDMRIALLGLDTTERVAVE